MQSPARPSPARAAVLLLLAACSPAQPGSGAGGGPGGQSERGEVGAAREVRLAPVALEAWERSVAATGELRAFEEVTVAVKVPGRLAELCVDLGAQVRQGELLARLEDRDYAIRVRQAEAAVAAARALLGLNADGPDDDVDPETSSGVLLGKAELEEVRLRLDRARTLAQQGVDSQAALDTTQAQFLAAESRLQAAREVVASRRAALAQRRAELESARALLEETRIEAPFDGRVGRRLTARGAYLSAGDALLELARVDPLRVVLEVPEREASVVRVGAPVRFEIEGRAEECLGRVERLAPGLRSEGRMLRVEAELPNPDRALLTGLFVRARIVTDAEARALCVPSDALVEFAGVQRVFLLGADGRAEERRVQLGRREAERAEVLEGLSAGERVVRTPGDLLAGTPLAPVD